VLAGSLQGKEIVPNAADPLKPRIHNGSNHGQPTLRAGGPAGLQPAPPQHPCDGGSGQGHPQCEVAGDVGQGPEGGGGADAGVCVCMRQAQCPMVAHPCAT